MIEILFKKNIFHMHRINNSSVFKLSNLTSKIDGWRAIYVKRWSKLGPSERSEWTR